MPKASASPKHSRRKRVATNRSATRRQRPSAFDRPLVIDEETAAALTLYNTYLVADREQRAHEQAIRKAERVKSEAAATVRKLNNRKTSSADLTAAETKYREAVEALNQLRGDGGSGAKTKKGKKRT